MTNINTELNRRIALIAADRQSGASELLVEVLGVLKGGLETAQPIGPIARALCRAQPSMASVWNAALAALAAELTPGQFDRFVERARRAPAAIERFAVELLGSESDLVTISFSGTVARVIEALARTRTVRVACGEGRPALEGRRLATRLAAAGIAVTCFSDGALGHALESAEAVVVGADAVTPDWFLNKSGTRMLAAAAAQRGVPVYVVAARDKFVSHSVANRLIITEGAPAEIWDAAPSGVAVRNPYFEPTPLDLVTAVISDAGVLGSGMVGDVCGAPPDAVLKALDAL
jgi:translation initiation factor 2B subunit (eIF-2B alpha/beta/delta family)